MPDPTLIFRGIDGSECEQFIQAIRQHAFAVGRSRDGEWLSDFAGTCFAGSALRWYETLSRDVQSNWDLLRKHMLSQYPQVRIEQDGSDGSLPPSQAVNLPIYPIISNMRTGRILVESPNAVPLRVGYISRSLTTDGTHQIKPNCGEALYVRFEPSDGPSGPCNVWQVNPATGLELLGVCFSGIPTFEPSTRYRSEVGCLTDLVRSTSSAKFGSSRGDAITSQSKVWVIDANSDIAVHWTDNAGTHKVGIVANTSNTGLYFHTHKLDEIAIRSWHHVILTFEQI